MTKKLLFPLIILIGLCILILAFYFGINALTLFHQQKAYISVNEQKGEDSVYVDGALKGKTPLLNTSLSAGSHLITIKNATNPDSYIAFSKNLSFEENSNSVISINLGPSDIYTGYNIFTFSQSSSTDTGILISSDNIESTSLSVRINGKDVTPGSVYPLSPGTYGIVYHADGYVDQQTKITIVGSHILQNIIHLAKEPI